MSTATATIVEFCLRTASAAQGNARRAAMRSRAKRIPASTSVMPVPMVPLWAAFWPVASFAAETRNE